MHRVEEMATCHVLSARALHANRVLASLLHEQQLLEEMVFRIAVKASCEQCEE